MRRANFAATVEAATEAYAGAAPDVWARDEEQPCCPRCQDAGYYCLDVAIDHPQFAQLQSCDCRTASSAQKRSERSNLAELGTYTFRTFNTALVGVQAAYDRCQIFATIPQDWLVLRGPYGCGKSHLATAIAHDAVARGYESLFITVPDVLDTLRSVYDSPAGVGTVRDHLERFKTVKLLILDDYGTQTDKPWVREKLFQILDARYRYRRATVLTTNLTPPQIDAVDGRIASRLFDAVLCEHLHITAGDYRRRSARERIPGGLQ